MLAVLARILVNISYEDACVLEIPAAGWLPALVAMLGSEDESVLEEAACVVMNISSAWQVRAREWRLRSMHCMMQAGVSLHACMRAC